MDVNLEPYTKDTAAAAADLERRGVVERIWQKDYTVWKPDPSEITNRLGWLTVTDLMREQIPALKSFAREVREASFSHVVLLGMGGSSLGPEVLRATFGHAAGYPELIVLDSTLPSCVQSVADFINAANTLFLVSSKSGTTMETISLFRYFWSLAESTTGRGKTGDNFTAITDPGTPLARLAGEKGFRQTFLNLPDIGGRYAVLSYVGLVPAALMGIDIEELLNRADSTRQECAAGTAFAENHGAWLGTVTGALATQGRDKLTIVTSPSVSSFGLWAEQLVAESTGKEGKGIIPVIGEPMVEPAHYGDDRFFVYLRLRDDDNSAADEAIKHLESSGQPIIVLEMRDAYDLAGEFFRWEFATAVAGALLGVNPFNQPNVEATKRAAERVLREFTASGQARSMEVKYAPADLLAGASKGYYLAILAYIRQTAEVDNTLAALRREVTTQYHIATTLGHGPRYLHSTGQLHKGGPSSGRFLIVTTDQENDLPIPGQPYSLGALSDAEAMGDFQTLQSSGRRVARIHFSHRDLSSISRLLIKRA